MSNWTNSNSEFCNNEIFNDTSQDGEFSESLGDSGNYGAIFTIYVVETVELVSKRMKLLSKGRIFFLLCLQFFFSVSGNAALLVFIIFPDNCMYLMYKKQALKKHLQDDEHQTKQ